MKKWIVFYNKHTNNELTRITIEGTFPDEIQATNELLASDIGLEVTDIYTLVK
ncbi:hypothetical protein [Bacillus pumilus]|uniref:hypothetical protein n=1 Tax=Bacillus pumilus TaxID=1408 RepID=UPI000A6D5F77|nr:hypothetical protein [Bacillus pumilus]